MKTKSYRFIRILGILATLAVFSTACQATPQRESKPSADWSRSVALGKFVNGSIGIAVDGAGEIIHMSWPADIGEGVYLRYVQLDSQANPLVSKNLEFPGFLRAPRLITAYGGNLHLFWASRLPGEKAWALWHVMIDMNGDITSSTTQVSQSDTNVGYYLVASDHEGGAMVCWESSTSGEIYLQHLDHNGSPTIEPLIITSKGEYPSLWLEMNDNVHLAWQEAGSLVYARSTLQSLSPDETTVIGDIPEGTGKSLDGPYLGVAGEWVYVFWSVLNQSGLEAGTGYTVYTAFPADAPAKYEAERILLSPAEEQPFTAYEGSLNLTQLAPPVEEAWASTDFVLSPNVMQGNQLDEMAVAMAMNQTMRMDQHLQIAVAVFQEGKFIGYTVGTKTENISDNPVLFVDNDRHLHLAWREGAAGNSVFYATTQPEAAAALERLTMGDIFNAIFQGGIEGLVGITFLPIIGFGWLLPGMVLIVIVKLFRDQDNLTEWKYWIPLIIAILLFYLVKLATLPTISSYVPFSAWLDIPQRFSTPLQILVPILIFSIAALVANYIRRSKSQSAAVFYITFVLIDAMLTLAIYGVNLLGVY